ncbi:MAG: BCCT family transporter, partial [Desulfobacterales bacterium]|nr:BCCT family transporter [Desulfobacterales bacterium]
SAVFIIATLISSEGVKGGCDKLFKFFTGYFGWTYLTCVAGFVLFCFAVALGKYGNIRLGKDDETPEFSLFAWFSMLFAAGMGIGLVFWGVAEPIYHFAGPPFADPKTPLAATHSMRTVIFHWGLHPWACYAVVAMLLAYSQFRKGNPALLSWTLEPLLGKKLITGALGKSIDTLAVVVTLFGVATSLGLGAMQVSTGLEKLYGIPSSTTVSISIIAIVTLLYIISAVTGINKGIKILSNTNMFLAFGLMLLVLCLGPTQYIFHTFIEALGNYFQNIIHMSFFIDNSGAVKAHSGYDWVGAWTIFYWAWWLTWAPFVGAFIARISRGRTIREFVFGCLLAPTLLCTLWFSIMGGSAIFMEMNGTAQIADATFKDVTSAIFVLFEHMPMGSLLSLLAMIIVSIFFITSADSATFVVGMMTSGGSMEPKNGLKIFWGLLCSTIAAMLLLAGGLKAVQSISFVVSFPFMLLMVVMIAAFVKALARENDPGFTLSQTASTIKG